MINLLADDKIMLEKLSQFLHRISIYGFWSSKLFSEDLRVSLKMLKPFIWMGFIGILGQTFAIFNFEKLGAMLLWSLNPR